MSEELEKKNEELQETSAFEPVEEGFDPKKEKRAKIGWLIFFAVIIVLMVVCIVAINLIPAD
ncbi:MAG: hypothetical protein MJ238_07020 [Bacilli bacterium]|nr:hypothetical protein [Bacilli bacterium]